MLKGETKDRYLFRLNVCGKLYEFHIFTLNKFCGGTLLEKLANSSHETRMKFCDCYVENQKIYCLWRSSQMFDNILSYLASGHLHCPTETCMAELLQELKFWQIDSSSIPSCCMSKLKLSQSDMNSNIEELLPMVPFTTEVIDESNATIALDHDQPQEPDSLMIHSTAKQENGKVMGCESEQNVQAHDECGTGDDKFTGIFLGNVRKVIWTIFEDPSSGLISKMITAISAGFVFTSLFVLIIGSLKEFQDETGEPIRQLIYTEYCCVAWFSFEYLLRFIITPDRLTFIKSPLNVVDALSLFPFYLEGGFVLSGRTADELQNWKGALLAMRILRVFRVARVLKLARYSGGLKSFGATLTQSKKEIGMLFMFLSTAMLLFSTSVYFFEKDHAETPFVSIPATFWWAVVTMTTVGYGDMIPVSFGGKLVASFATISGVIVLAFPITMIVENFNQHYHTEIPNVQSNEEDEDPAEPKISHLHVRSVAIV